jgi:hypothetical protein
VPVADPPVQDSVQGHGNDKDKSDSGNGNSSGGEDNPGKGHDKNK